ncbi:synaptotagmin-like protein 3 isoform X2 [Hippocampus comes]|uniref:synaptotagmin-like protein 3 isoform X2 n=1 Tax=Hippocampus comes TaxID=109280 RepID=UPI00094E342C|nr:PREDICTED: synaptotagmin-like protein 3 isoform X2 [Hippocampus comes]
MLTCLWSAEPEAPDDAEVSEAFRIQCRAGEMAHREEDRRDGQKTGDSHLRMDFILLQALEREKILEVLRRDKLLRAVEEDRIRRMKFQLQELRRRGAKSHSKEYGERTCARCQRPLGKFCNTGAICRGCSHRICVNCRVRVREVAWKCTVCYAYREVKIRSGDWFVEETTKKFPPLTDKHVTVGEKLLKTYSYIAIVPPTPPAYTGFDLEGRSGNSNKFNVRTKSEDHLFSFTTNVGKMSSSQNDLSANLLNVGRGKHLRFATQKSLSDTDLGKSVQLYHAPSLPDLFKRSKDSDQEGPEEETSNSSENYDGKRGSFSSISTECSLLEGVSASGDMELALAYNSTTSCLEITIGACRNLPHGDTAKRTCNPYVKFYVMPPKSDKRKTAVQRNTIHPVYNELFQYHIERHLLTGKRLQASVWHSEFLHRKVFLGEVLIPLDGFQFQDKNFQRFNWYPLCPQLSKYPEEGAEELNGGDLMSRFQSSFNSH